VRGTPLSPQLWILRRYFPPQIGGVRVYSAKLIRRTTIPDASSSMRARNGAPKKKKKKKKQLSALVAYKYGVHEVVGGDLFLLVRG
jgi:hypothetical protein